MVIQTRRLTVVPATAALVAAELSSAPDLATALGAELPADWPPERHDSRLLERSLESLGSSPQSGWDLHYVVWTTGPLWVLVGVCGYKGPPAPPSMTVEVGYSVVPSWRRRGIATEATGGLIDAAWERGAKRVIAHTLPELEGSIGVLAKLGFVPAPAREAGTIGFELTRVV